MEVMHRRVAGLDVHKGTVVACVRVMASHKATRECRTFATTTEGLEELAGVADGKARCRHVAMEATGVYWTPVWKILSEGDFDLLVANAAHIKQVPGRKTDMNDAMWIADLLACGLIRASFVPAGRVPGTALADAHPQATGPRARHGMSNASRRRSKRPTSSSGSVLSDLLGVSGRRMIEAMIAGVRDPHRLAALAKRSVKASPKELYDALHGQLREHHRFLLALHLQQWDALDAAIRQIDEQVANQIEGMDEGLAERAVALLRTDHPPVRDPRRQRAVGDRHPGRDRPRHEPLRDGWPPRRLGRALPRPERECRQAQVHAPAQRRSLAQDDARAMCVGGQTQQEQLLQSTVPSPVRPPRAAEGDLSRRRFHPHGHLPHAEIRRAASRPRRRLLRPPRTGSQSQASGSPARQARLRGTTPTPRRGCLMLRSCYIAEVSCSERSDEAIPTLATPRRRDCHGAWRRLAMTAGSRGQDCAVIDDVLRGLRVSVVNPRR